MNAPLPKSAFSIPFKRRAFQLNLDIHSEIIVDCFAGGGGGSEGTEMALGRRVDIAINHNHRALSMHMANHPETQHYCEDVRDIDPRMLTEGRAVGYAHFSPDCRHHSQAAGGQPRSDVIRGLAWQAIKWAGTVRPRFVSIENVSQLRLWGRLIAKRDQATGRVIKLDGSVAAKGEHVPVQEQFLVPDPKDVGRRWQHFLRRLASFGYVIEHKVLCAADYGAPTTRKRLILLARCDGKPIVWPAQTHFEKPKPGQKPWRGASEVLDFSLECRSIFDREKALANASMKRIAKGTWKFVINDPDPFLVPYEGNIVAGNRAVSAPHLTKFRFDSEGVSVKKPVPTITAGGNSKRPAGAAHALGLSSAILVQAAHGEGKPGGVQRWGMGSRHIKQPVGTVTASGGHSIAQPRLVEMPKPINLGYMAQMNGGFNDVRGTPGYELSRPLSSITQKGAQQQLITAHAVAEFGLSEELLAGAIRVAKLILTYVHEKSTDEIDSMSLEALIAVVTLSIKGASHVVVDIGLRMLTPRELYACMGFPADYIIEMGHDGKVFPKSDQVHMCGNSHSPLLQKAIVEANLPEMVIREPMAA